ncbi:hypothetical protein SH668x_002785 [Planctomicrobium sp. SH668]|uniref:hypothetical protein n=1 Tax=Planctomicrobium sp. SH668 TaxID=3448126 RepID=UPI003F5C7399
MQRLQSLLMSLALVLLGGSVFAEFPGGYQGSAPYRPSLTSSFDEQLPFLPPAPESLTARTGTTFYRPDVVAQMPAEPVQMPQYQSFDPALSRYWMVSSRQSVQNINDRNRGPWGLHIHELHCDGSSQASNIGLLSQQIVPGVPVCIFVHGSFVELPNQYVEAAGFYTAVRGKNPSPLHMIFFTWPSDGPYTGIFPVDVAIRGRQADFNGFHLAYLISQIPAECPICLVGHSHGTRAILSAMHLAGGGTIEGCSFPYSMGQNRRYRAVLAAAAFDHNWLNPGHQFDRSLNPLEGLVNLRNRNDLALAAYPLSRPFAHRATARSGFTEHDARMIGYNAAKIREADVTDIVGRHHYWPYYYKSPTIINTISPYIFFQ